MWGDWRVVIPARRVRSRNMAREWAGVGGLCEWTTGDGQEREDDCTFPRR